MGEHKGYIRNADAKGSVNISEDVVATIASNAASEVEGVTGFYYSQGKDITSMIGKRHLPRGIKLTVTDGAVTLDVYIVVDIGFSVNEIGEKVQKAVIAAVVDATGAKVDEVNVHICGVSIKKAKKQ
ncbi:MAG: Asp23/Gls24 family envelope stress response protein [Oscillospiraceae bacterium]|nr:Asp23/Gls24 family envelope stress response protein [Oscillospiraceae bacterium]